MDLTDMLFANAMLDGGGSGGGEFNNSKLTATLVNTTNSDTTVTVEGGIVVDDNTLLAGGSEIEISANSTKTVVCYYVYVYDNPNMLVTASEIEDVSVDNCYSYIYEETGEYKIAFDDPTKDATGTFSLT